MKSPSCVKKASNWTCGPNLFPAAAHEELLNLRLPLLDYLHKRTGNAVTLVTALVSVSAAGLQTRLRPVGICDKNAKD
jgi:hypothetical protein